VQHAGRAMKIDASILLKELHSNKDLRDVLLRYIQAFTARLSQTTTCNSLHNIDTAPRFAILNFLHKHEIVQKPISISIRVKTVHS
jgi:hypothetical protein